MSSEMLARRYVNGVVLRRNWYVSQGIADMKRSGMALVPQPGMAMSDCIDMVQLAEQQG
jgi:hypothetical protein